MREQELDWVTQIEDQACVSRDLRVDQLILDAWTTAVRPGLPWSKLGLAQPVGSRHRYQP